MYILKNALVSITRNKGRNLLIGIIVIVIACATTITLAIRTSATNLITSYDNKYDITATIGINRESMRGMVQGSKDSTTEQKNNMQAVFQNASSIKKEDVEKYGDSSLVKEYYYTLSVGVNSDDLEKASSTSNNSSSPDGRGKKDNFNNLTTSDFTLQGYSSLNSMNEFISGKYIIKEGNLASDMENLTCVINSEMASINNISVNDEITFVDPDNANNTVTLVVTGIFEEKSETNEVMGMFTTSANTIITNVNVINVLINNNTEMKTSLIPTFILNNKDVIEDFTNELKEKGLSEYLTVTTNLEEVSNATNIISNVLTFATVFLILTLIIGGIVLFVINMINIHERRYEIGVLRTIGMKKRYLTIQFLSELLIVSIIALLIGGLIGASSSVSVANHLLETEIQNANAEKEKIGENFGGKMGVFNKVSGVANVETIDKIDAVVDLKVLFQLIGIGIFLTIISGTSGVLSIQKFSPLTILKERS